MFHRERAVLLTKNRRELFDDVQSKKRRWGYLCLLVVAPLSLLSFGCVYFKSNRRRLTMKGKYKLIGPVVSLEVKLEQKTAETLAEMSRHTYVAELARTWGPLTALMIEIEKKVGNLLNEIEKYTKEKITQCPYF